EHRLQGRGGKGLISIRTTERNGKVAGVSQVRDDDEVMLITNTGILIRMAVREISVIGRATQGVRLITLDSRDEKVVAVARIAEGEATTRDETPPKRGPLSPAPRGTAAPGPVPRRTCMRPVAFVALGFLLVACQSSIDSRLEEARELVFRQRPEEAIAAYRSLLYALEGQNDERAQKARIEALSRIGDLSYLEKRDIQGAAEAYRTLIRLAPNAEEAYWAREKLAEIAHHHLRDLPEAITHWQVLATSGREGSEQFAYRVARAYFEARDYEQSRKECEN